MATIWHQACQNPFLPGKEISQHLMYIQSLSRNTHPHLSIKENYVTSQNILTSGTSAKQVHLFKGTTKFLSSLHIFGSAEFINIACQLLSMQKPVTNVLPQTPL